VHRAWRSASPQPISRAIATPCTTLFAILCWVPFRQTTWAGTMSMYAALFGFGTGRNVWLPAVLGWSLLFVIAGHSAGVALARNDRPRFLGLISAEREDSPISGMAMVFGLHTIRGAFFVAMIVLTIYFFGAAATSPFIYFRF
jgi:hypothetical protein